MPELSNLLAYGLISLGMVLTPGPNMIYLISRSICQGRKAAGRADFAGRCGVGFCRVHAVCGAGYHRAADDGAVCV
jgi:threonine/homoserine/homoserine lactone efflux protein